MLLTSHSHNTSHITLLFLSHPHTPTLTHITPSQYCQHHSFLGKRRETHFFDWRWPDHLDGDPAAAAAAAAAAATVSTTTSLSSSVASSSSSSSSAVISSSSTTTSSSSSAQLEEYKKYYNADALFKYPSLLTGESTPSYLLHSDLVIPRIKAVCPWVKLLVVLRDPVDRAYSQYQMCNDPNGTPEQLQVTTTQHTPHHTAPHHTNLSITLHDRYPSMITFHQVRDTSTYKDNLLCLS